MNWLLFTAIGNPGDEFVRLGVESLIRSVDKDCDFSIVHKHRTGSHEPIPFDRAVVCGMPLAWSHDTESCWREHWWRPLNEWVARDPKKLMLAGVGSFAEWPGDPRVADPQGLFGAFNHLANRSFHRYARDPILEKITSVKTEVLPCPSVFSTKPSEPRWKLCNLMGDGAHYAKYGPQEAEAWKRIRGRVASILLRNGFSFVAHDRQEFELAEMFGWPRQNIVSNNGDPRHLLKVYSKAKCYFGNRVHGAIVSRSVGANVWSIGYDSRQEAVKTVGGRATPPSLLDLDEFHEWAMDPPDGEPFDIKHHRSIQQSHFQRFANQ